MRTCHRHYPGGFNGACSLVYLHCQRPSPCNSKVGSCNCFFGACSAFTHVMACTLAESPSDPLHRELRQPCCLRCRLDCYRVERTARSAGGISPPAAYRTVRKSLDLHGSSQTCTCPLAKANLRRTWMLLPVSWLAVTFFDLRHPLRSALITRASTLLQDDPSSSSALLLSPFMDSTYRVFA